MHYSRPCFLGILLLTQKYATNSIFSDFNSLLHSCSFRIRVLQIISIFAYGFFCDSSYIYRLCYMPWSLSDIIHKHVSPAALIFIRLGDVCMRERKMTHITVYSQLSTEPGVATVP